MRIFTSAVESANEQKQTLTDLARMAEGGVESKLNIFLSAVEQGPQKESCSELMEGKTPFLWNLMSYYYLRKDIPYAEMVRDNSQLVLIDSGAHSFQKGTKVKWDEYTKEYADFIKAFDKDNVVGYFEMDVDNVLGYEKVLELREVLHERSGLPDKIIPVWHRNRGIAEFKKMCADREGLVVAITGFKNEDIKDDQYLMFLKEARKHNCKVHCLGMTRRKVLDKVPFDYVDSSSWAQQAIFGRVAGRKVSKEFSKTNRTDVFKASYLEAMKMQMHYYEKWKRMGFE